MHENANILRVVGARGSTIDQARDYEPQRARSRRSRNLHRIETHFAETALSAAGLDAVVLDAPCGTGRLLPVLCRAARLYMFDLAQNMLTLARQKVVNMSHVSAQRADIRELPLPDNAVDLAFCMRLLHHFDDDEMRTTVLGELARVSRRFVAFSFYNANCLKYRWRRLRGASIRCHYVPFGHMAELCQSVGLRIVRRRPLINIHEQQCFVLCEVIDRDAQRILV